MDATKDLKWVIGAILILWLVWFFTGGPSNERAVGGAFVKPPAPLNSGQTYGELPSGNLKIENKNSNKFSKGVIFLSDTKGAKKTLRGGEYVEITSSFGNKQSINISNWMLKNSQRSRFLIGKASKLPYLNKINSENSLYLAPGEKAIISSGRSPLGVSFKLNKCSGYLEEFQNFTPPIPQKCPNLLSDPEIASYNLDDACLSYLGGLNSCQIPLDVYNNSATGENLSVSCLLFLENKANYNSCVNTYKNYSNFYKPEWRIYLGQKKGIWNNFKEKIDLLNPQGRMIDTVWY